MKAFLVLFLLVFFPFRQLFAIYDPTSVANNKYGIHIADHQDILNAANLVNSNGDWGYVTLVIQENDRNTNKWQRIFDQMRRLHVIPIVRLATQPEGNVWQKPNTEDIRDWKLFLSSLNWPIENRYVIIFNEPNHAAEWGGRVSPEQYAQILDVFARELKAVSEDFFILPAALDASAPDGPTTMDEQVFISRMLATKPDILSLLDGWTSHSYPNPAFSGAPDAIGRGTLRTYLWELSLLGKQFPVFITETGWQHSDGLQKDSTLLPPDVVATYIKSASEIWGDRRIVSVTPFIFNYQGLPFDHFSWRKLGEDGFYPHYFSYRDLAKIRGQPRQRESYQMIKSLIPQILVADARITLVGEIKNTGQAILNPSDYQLVIYDDSGLFNFISENVPNLEPGESGSIVAHMTTPKEGTYRLGAIFVKGQTQIEIEVGDVTLIPPPKLTIRIAAGWRPNPALGNVSVIVYDEDENAVHEFRGLTLRGGQVLVEGIKNIVPGQTYRIVVLIPGYLPRQAHVALDQAESTAQMRRLLPFDFNFDGAFTLKDLPAFFQTRPHNAWLRFFGP